jgi:paraquat-inducible protein A
MSPCSQANVNLHRPTAFALAAAVMLVPANLLPILNTRLAGAARTDTIWSGIVELYETGLWPLAVIVFIASLAIPIFKLAGLACLLFAARHNIAGISIPTRRKLTRLYAFLDVIGRWSMLDVFLVAFLSGIVRFGAPAMVAPRAGVVAFAAAVVLTILATRAFDPRTLWPSASPVTNTVLV